MCLYLPADQTTETSVSNNLATCAANLSKSQPWRLMGLDEYNGPIPENRDPLGKGSIYSDSERDDHNGGVCD